MENLHATCNRCGGTNGRKHRWCSTCKREYDREERARDKALRTARLYQRRGLLKPEPCCVCGKEEGVEMHHDDPTQPLDVRWACESCAPVLAQWRRRSLARAA